MSTIREILADYDPEILLCDGFDDALLGVGHRCSEEPVAVYDLQKIRESLIRDGASDEEAQEHIAHNILGSWVGERTPIFVEPLSSFY